MRSPLQTVTAALLLIVSGITAAQAAPRVVASIGPIHSLVAGVMAGIGDPTLLMKGGSSPHAYALKPSDARRLEAADAVFWVGEGMETFLAKPMAVLPRKARVVTLSAVPGVALFDLRTGGVWSEHADEQEHDVEHHDDEDLEHKGAQDDGDDHDDEPRAHGDYDLHVWLDPANAQAMVRAIVRALSDIDATNAPRYEANGAALLQRLVALDRALRQELEPLTERPYIVFHDAYQYFEARYGLAPAGSVSLSPDRAPGAARLVELRRTIVEAGALCVFAEPQFEPAILRVLVEDTGAKNGVLDPLGIGLEPGADAYFTLLTDLAASLRQCLAPGGG